MGSDKGVLIPLAQCLSSYPMLCRINSDRGSVKYGLLRQIKPASPSIYTSDGKLFTVALFCYNVRIASQLEYDEYVMKLSARLGSKSVARKFAFGGFRMEGTYNTKIWDLRDNDGCMSHT